MYGSKRAVRALLGPTRPDRLCASLRGISFGSVRTFYSTPSRQTDGVFRGLEDTRLPVPWIEAWRLQKEGKNPVPTEDSHQKRDLSPKKMSDSYHRVVSFEPEIPPNTNG